MGEVDSAGILRPHPTRVNTLSPGPIKTPLFAQLARFLLSGAPSFIIGEDIVIDGGARHT